MRPTLTACRTGLSVAAAVVLLSACGADEEAPTAENGFSGADSEFCTDAAAIQERVGATLNDEADPTALPQALQEAAAQIRAVEAPPEISDDWNALADGVEQIATAFASIDVDDPNSLATFQEQVGQLQGRLATASTNVEIYLREECGIDLDSGEPAAPTS
jgi:hypothetical protein